MVAHAIQSYKRLPGSPLRGGPVSVLTNAPTHAAILYPVLLEVISYLIHEGTGCRDPEYLAILYPGLFGPGGCG